MHSVHLAQCKCPISTVVTVQARIAGHARSRYPPFNAIDKINYGERSNAILYKCQKHLLYLCMYIFYTYRAFLCNTLYKYMYFQSCS